jgi:DNA invertase Pin-like site-specific DNA recombinase
VESVAKIVSFARDLQQPVFLVSWLRKCILQKQAILRGFLRRFQRNHKMKIGYARVSTLEQNLELQLQALKNAGCRRTFQEKISGVSRNRPEFQRMLDQIRENDIIVVWKLDRLARSTRDLLETMETIREAGGKFQSLSEPWADTTTHAGKLIMTIFAGIAEFERDLIRERTGAGRLAAKKRGVRFGRPPKLSSDQEHLARRLVSEGKSVREIASVFKVHAATIYRLAAS